MDISLCMKCGKRKRHERNGRVFKLCAVCALENLQTLLKGEDNEFACHSCDGTGYIDGSQCDSCGGLGFFADDYEEAKEITDNEAAGAGAIEPLMVYFCPRCGHPRGRYGNLVELCLHCGDVNFYLKGRQE